MNLKKLGKMSGMVAAVAMLAMVLQGCGGDDNGSNVSQDMYDSLKADYDKAVADRDAAMSAQATAEAAATTAMAAQMEAEAAEMAAKEAQATAVAAKDDAVKAQAVAEAAQKVAEDAKMTAEAAAKEAMAAKEKAESDLVTANTDKAVAVQAAADAKAAQEKAEAAQATAVAAQKTAEDERDAANEAKMMAEEAQKTAEDAKMKADEAAAAAKTAQDLAEDAQAKAEKERDAAKDAQAKAEKERDDALAKLKGETDADTAKRARIDAAAIQKAADDLTALVPNAQGGVERQTVSRANTVEMFQGNGSVPGDGPDGPIVYTSDQTPTDDNIDRYGELRPNAAPGNTANNRPLVSTGVMTLTATRVGSTVTFEATADDNPADSVGATVLFDIKDATAGADGMTSHMAEVDMPGGLTKHLYLMSDIEGSLSSSFADNLPEDLSVREQTPFDPVTQRTRYDIDNNVGVSTDASNQGADTPITTEAQGVGAINTADNSLIDITLGAAYTPSQATLTVNVQQNASFDGTYAGVPGSYSCAVANCGIYLNPDGEVILGNRTITGGNRQPAAVGTWTFSPTSKAVSVADDDYLIYGAWLKKPDSAVGTGSAAAIAAGSDLYDESASNNANGMTTLVGKATYSGSAAGFFADRRVDSDGAVSGTFTATAELTADFETGATVGSISGMIKDFTRSDDTAADWVVELKTEAINVADDVGGFVEGDTAGTASGVPWSGEWGVQFVGGGGPTPNATPTLHPTGVVGTFGAQRGSPEALASGDTGFVGVIGGFGARKQ